MVPLEAVVNFAGVTKVFVIQNNTAHTRPVTTGRIKDGRQEIISGLKPAEIVALAAHETIRSGQSPNPIVGNELALRDQDGKPIKEMGAPRGGSIFRGMNDNRQGVGRGVPTAPRPGFMVLPRRGQDSRLSRLSRIPRTGK